MKNEQLRKHLKTTWGSRWRYFKYKRMMNECGSNVFFDQNIRIMRYPGNVSIGNNVIVKEGVRICSCNQDAQITIGENTTIGYHTFIFSSEEITIGKDCLVAPFVYFVDSDHSIDRNVNINTQTNVSAPITIKDDVWIGTGAKILKGVTIEKGAIIAAGAVVKNDVPSYTIYGGIPAQKIGERT